MLLIVVGSYLVILKYAQCQTCVQISQLHDSDDDNVDDDNDIDHDDDDDDDAVATGHSSNTVPSSSTSCGG
jgi:hypothetical protein